MFFLGDMMFFCFLENVGLALRCFGNFQAFWRELRFLWHLYVEHKFRGLVCLLWWNVKCLGTHTPIKTNVIFSIYTILILPDMVHPFKCEFGTGNAFTIKTLKIYNRGIFNSSRNLHKLYYQNYTKYYFFSYFFMFISGRTYQCIFFIFTFQACFFKVLLIYIYISVNFWYFMRGFFWCLA